MAHQQRAAGDSGASTALCDGAARHSGKVAPARGPLTACPALFIRACVIPPINRPLTQLTCCQHEGEEPVGVGAGLFAVMLLLGR